MERKKNSKGGTRKIIRVLPRRLEEELAIRSKRSASDDRELLAGIDVLEDRFLEAGEMPVAFL